MKLDAVGVDEELHEYEKFVKLGANGYLLIRYKTPPVPGDDVPVDVQDAVFCLASGSQIWSRPYHDDVDQKYVPMIVGEDRVYFGTVTYGHGPAMLRAYALHSGELLYETETVVPHTNCFYGVGDTKSHRFGYPLELLRADKDELILAFKTQRGFRERGFHDRLATIWLINGADGSLRQKTRVILIGHSYVRLSPNRTAFSNISHQDHHPLIKVETFSRQSNGEFAATRVDMVDPQTACEPRWLSLDPFTGCTLALEGKYVTPHCSSLRESVDPDTVSSIEAKRPLWFSFSGKGGEDRQLTAADTCKISLPPRSRRSIVRRPFPSRHTRAYHVRFTDGYRAVMECEEGNVYLIDFTPRRYNGLI
ncbi:hypothetical protein BJX63DRAFT_410891, partial [Aspergillus granulosus]